MLLFFKMLSPDQIFEKYLVTFKLFHLIPVSIRFIQTPEMDEY